MQITVQVFQNGEAIGEYRANVKEAKTEQEAVDTFLKYARIDLRYVFLGARRKLTPSSPNDSYLVAGTFE